MIATFRSLLVALFGFMLGLLVAAAALPAMAFAQAGPIEPAPVKIQSMVVYGDDPCPTSSSGEIVVCARQPESERYRIPKQFRGKKADASPANNAWANKTRVADQASRAAAGVPNSCSPVGAAGQTGCFQAFQAQAAAARRQQADGAVDIP